MHILNLKHDNIGYDTTEGIQVGYTTVNQNFLPHKPGAISVVDHEITTSTWLRNLVKHAEAV
jgi:hypothetical protein